MPPKIPLNLHTDEAAQRQKAYQQTLSATLGVAVGAHDVLDLRTTAEWSEGFAEAIAACQAGDRAALVQTWPTGQLERLAARLSAIPEVDDPERPVFLYTAEAQSCGAVVVRLAEVLAEPALLRLLGELSGSPAQRGAALRVGSKDLSDGLLVRALPSEQSAALGAPAVLEAIVWGDNWLAA